MAEQDPQPHRCKANYRAILAIAGRVGAVGGWLLLNLLAYYCLVLFGGSESLVTIGLVAVLSPLYICLVHYLDRRLEWFGLRHLSQILSRSDASKDAFTKQIGLQTLVITSGFAATLFLLSMEFHVEFYGDQRPGFILEAMTILFFVAGILNLLQIVLLGFRSKHDFSESGLAPPGLERHLDKKISIFRDISWHALLAPLVLAFSILDFRLCVVVNGAYGILLFTYYFLPCGPKVIEHLYSQSRGTSATNSQPNEGR